MISCSTYVATSSRYLENASKLTLSQGNLVLRINHEKITVAFRSQRLVELAERRIGKTTSQIYAEVLRQLERNIQRCQTEPTEVLGDDDEPASLPSISTSELSSLLFQDLDFMGAIGEPDVNRLGSKRPQFRKKQEKKYKSGDEALAVGNASPDESDEEDMDDVHVNGHHPEADGTLSMDDADPILDSWDEDDGTNGRTSFEHRRRMSKIKQHLHLLAEDPLEFVQIVEKYGELNEWAVDFAALTEQLRQLELENTITSRFGPAAARMVRIFLDKGKLDEKQITNLGLIHQKQMRAVLTIMHEAGHLELQEVPRDNSRQPSRTMYLWYFEPERCRQLVLEETYKAMARCLQRVKVERLAIQALIDKAERTDVVGKEEQYLSINERVVLSRWREKEARLLGEVGRLDDLAGVLRDY